MYHGYDMHKITEHMANAPKKKLIFDTTVYNGINDPFAVAYAMTADTLDVLALSAAPFTGENASVPADGMEKSYEGLVRARDFINPDVPCYRGSCEYMKNIITPVKSEAAENIVRIVNEADDIVYIMAHGTFTNIASALILDPSIADKAVVVLLASLWSEREQKNAYNFTEDRIAARVILECGVPVIVSPTIENGYIPLMMSNAETAYYFDRDSGDVSKFLYSSMVDAGAPTFDENGLCRLKERPIFDIATLAVLRNPEKAGGTKIIPSVSLDDKGNRVELNNGKNMMFIAHLERNPIMSDFFTTISLATIK